MGKQPPFIRAWASRKPGQLLAAFALTTMRELPHDRPLGDV